MKKMKKICEIGKHRLRTNKFGVTWCIECGILSNKPAKPLDKNGQRKR